MRNLKKCENKPEFKPTIISEFFKEKIVKVLLGNNEEDPIFLNKKLYSVVYLTKQ